MLGVVGDEVRLGLRTSLCRFCPEKAQTADVTCQDAQPVGSLSETRPC